MMNNRGPGELNFSVDAEQMSKDDSIVKASGEIDIYAAHEFKQTITDQIDAGVRHVVVDLTATEFIDSTALGVLVSTRKRLGESGTLSIVSNDENITRIFEITALDRIFNVYDISNNFNTDHAYETEKQTLGRRIANFVLNR